MKERKESRRMKERKESGRKNKGVGGGGKGRINQREGGK